MSDFLIRVARFPPIDVVKSERSLLKAWFTSCALNYRYEREHRDFALCACSWTRPGGLQFQMARDELSGTIKRLPVLAFIFRIPSHPRHCLVSQEYQYPQTFLFTRSPRWGEVGLMTGTYDILMTCVTEIRLLTRAAMLSSGSWQLSSWIFIRRRIGWQY